MIDQQPMMRTVVSPPNWATASIATVASSQQIISHRASICIRNCPSDRFTCTRHGHCCPLATSIYIRRDRSAHICVDLMDEIGE